MSHGATGKADYANPEHNVFIDSHSARREFDGRSKRTQFLKTGQITREGPNNS